ncbi:uncharacterized protein LY79DRAFT_143315 [Colletotrichum navitas]|uniref:Uncharacterized protein n=1 Tax=Colletotrichum navitas TaxID=681940 RepID=A0AAD8VAR2_9PEZI|nr:uncharacterized protein LY79DRAFT_143315 [Colletotrichum navitas]KAK1599524.1 hypothetical protein LY79DRAFT_143315 [Colletotrichum navitas]
MGSTFNVLLVAKRSQSEGPSTRGTRNQRPTPTPSRRRRDSKQESGQAPEPLCRYHLGHMSGRAREKRGLACLAPLGYFDRSPSDEAALPALVYTRSAQLGACCHYEGPRVRVALDEAGEAIANPREWYGGYSRWENPPVRFGGSEKAAERGRGGTIRHSGRSEAHSTTWQAFQRRQGREISDGPTKGQRKSGVFRRNLQ